MWKAKFHTIQCNDKEYYSVTVAQVVHNRFTYIKGFKSILTLSYSVNLFFNFHASEIYDVFF